MSASRLTPTLRVACKLLQVGSPSPNHWAPFEASLIRLQTSFRSVSCLHISAGSLEGPIEGSYPPANVLLDPLLQEGWPANNQVSRYARSDSPSRRCPFAGALPLGSRNSPPALSFGVLSSSRSVRPGPACPFCGAGTHSHSPSPP